MWVTTRGSEPCSRRRAAAGRRRRGSPADRPQTVRGPLLPGIVMPHDLGAELPTWIGGFVTPRARARARSPVSRPPAKWRPPSETRRHDADAVSRYGDSILHSAAAAVLSFVAQCTFGTEPGSTSNTSHLRYTQLTLRIGTTRGRSIHTNGQSDVTDHARAQAILLPPGTYTRGSDTGWISPRRRRHGIEP